MAAEAAGPVDLVHGRIGFLLRLGCRRAGGGDGEHASAGGDDLAILHSGAGMKHLATLPDATRVCCTHEYTLSNLRFAAAVEPDNEALARYTATARHLRLMEQPTLPSTLALERQINPFLRTRLATVIRAVQGQDASASDELSVFAALRRWKNEFK